MGIKVSNSCIEVRDADNGTEVYFLDDYTGSQCVNNGISEHYVALPQHTAQTRANRSALLSQASCLCSHKHTSLRAKP